ncbi:MAG TPA: CoA transferase [Lysobacter sp.]
MKQAPLKGLRVLDFGHYIAGPLAGVFLADQGADVIRIERPNARDWDPNTDAALARGKRSVQVDLKDTVHRARVLALAADCDVILENFRPGVMDRLGLGYEAIAAINPGVIYVSMPGYSRSDPRAQLPVWDGTISAACGFYTSLSIGGAALDLPPTYTPLSLPSVYAGLWGAISALAALYARQAHGRGDRIESPLMDAAMSAAAGVILQIVDQPSRYNVPPLPRRLLDRISLRGLSARFTARAHDLIVRMMPPVFRNYVCGDGQLLFVCAIDNANHVAKLLDATDLRAEANALGFRFGDVLDAPSTRDNINAYRGTSRRWRALGKLLEHRFASESADAWAERLALAGVPAARQRSTREWAEMPAMLAAGVLVKDADGRVQPAPQVDVEGQRFSTCSTRVEGSAAEWPLPRSFDPSSRAGAASTPNTSPLEGVRVLDLANVIAGPSAGRTLAELGAEVTHVSAVAPRMGPRMNLLFGIEANQGKRSIALDVHHPEGQAAVHGLLPKCDVLIHNKLPGQARRLGVAPEQVHAINDRTIVGAVTAYSGVNPGKWEERPGYDPVVQALSGIMLRYGGEKAPAVHGLASCIDYFTGYSAAFGVLVGLIARSRGDRRIVARTSLARTAGWVQLPQLCNPNRVVPTGLLAQGEGSLDRLYRARDGWVHLGPAPRSQAPDIPIAPKDAQPWLMREIRTRSAEQAVAWARSRGLVAHVVMSARYLRRHAVDAMPRGSRLNPTQSSGNIVRVQHPAGEAYFAPDASWLRFQHALVRRIDHAPMPGQHTVEVLRDAGFSPEGITRLLESGIATERWQGLSTYLPD